MVTTKVKNDSSDNRALIDVHFALPPPVTSHWNPTPMDTTLKITCATTANQQLFIPGSISGCEQSSTSKQQYQRRTMMASHQSQIVIYMYIVCVWAAAGDEREGLIKYYPECPLWQAFCSDSCLQAGNGKKNLLWFRLFVAVGVAVPRSVEDVDYTFDYLVSGICGLGFARMILSHAYFGGKLKSINCARPRAWLFLLLSLPLFLPNDTQLTRQCSYTCTASAASGINQGSDVRCGARNTSGTHVAHNTRRRRVSLPRRAAGGKKMRCMRQYILCPKTALDTVSFYI